MMTDAPSSAHNDSCSSAQTPTAPRSLAEARQRKLQQVRHGIAEAEHIGRAALAAQRMAMEAERHGNVLETLMQGLPADNVFVLLAQQLPTLLPPLPPSPLDCEP
jgi:hypothetical protein